MNNFLLTYVENDEFTYTWFETDEEMFEFVTENPDIKIEEALEVTVVRTFDFNERK